MTSKLINNIRNSALVGLAALSCAASGCRDMSKDFQIVDTTNGYEFLAGYDGRGRHVTVKDLSDTSKIYATDRTVSGSDRIFEGISLKNVQDGSRVNSYINQDSLNLIWERLSIKAGVSPIKCRGFAECSDSALAQNGVRPSYKK